LNRERVAESSDLTEILAYTSSPDEVSARVADEIGQGIDPGRIVLGLQAYPPCAVSRKDLALNVQRGLDLGIKQFSYYNYGIMPRANLDWIRHCSGLLRST
jgi:hypothetical protein